MNKNLFASAHRAGHTLNNVGGVAHAVPPEAELAQYVLTGCFNNTFYASAAADTKRIADLARSVPVEFLAKLAVYARREGYMKDAPALMLAVLSTRDSELFRRAFPLVIDNGKMLRNFVQVMRSGIAGRKSLGSGPKARVADWINAASVPALINASVGNDPSLADVIKLSRPKAAVPERERLYGYLIGKPVDQAALPAEVVALEQFKAAPEGKLVPKVDFRLVDRYLTREQWKDVARSAGWQMTRMNLNTFMRHGVFEDASITCLIADRLAARAEIERARVFPYQLLAAYRNASAETPGVVLDALHAALDIAVENVPAVDGTVAVFPDVSGSMQSPVTGYRSGSTSAVRCIDVAALMAASVLKKNPDAVILPFAGDVVTGLKLSARDSVLTNAEKLAAIGGGSTACAAPLRHMNHKRQNADLVIYVSDNESWVDRGYGTRTGTETEWREFKRRNAEARMVCIDITPNDTTQARTDVDVLNVGGFSDAVFDVVAGFAAGYASGHGGGNRGGNSGGPIGSSALIERIAAVTL